MNRNFIAEVWTPSDNNSSRTNYFQIFHEHSSIETDYFTILYSNLLELISYYLKIKSVMLHF